MVDWAKKYLCDESKYLLLRMADLLAQVAVQRPVDWMVAMAAFYPPESHRSLEQECR